MAVAAVETDSQGEGNEPHGLDDLIEKESVNEQQQEKQQQQELIKANEPSQAEIEQAKKLAAEINGAFLSGVNYMVCPSVEIDKIAEREKGDEAFYPLALKHGGKMPPWLAVFYEDYKPYIGAAIYMGKTIAVARQVERHIQEQQAEAEKEKQQNSEGQDSGDQ